MTLWAWLDGDLPLEDARQIRAHMATCEACRRRIKTLNLIRDGFAALPVKVWLPGSRFQPYLWVPALITGAYAMLLAAMLPLLVYGYLHGPLKTLLDLKLLIAGLQTASRLLLPALLPPALLSLGLMSLLGLWGLRRVEAFR
ncbi:MAG: zf-HC2 domain-containing protein [Candidatus Hydrothermae bacterium]|nr:zf-HC2 domain-containing protein [Candidatus Hydrothermae bacterium]